MVPLNSEPSRSPPRPIAGASRMGLLMVKVGGGLLRSPGRLDEVGRALADAGARRSLVIVPGGGPFADEVRRFEGAHGLGSSAAHWMAILAMDQYAHALAEHVPGGQLVDSRPGVLAAHACGRIPVLAPFRWLRAADELPHSWEVTSDSLAAYLATLLGAEELVLVKPAEGGAELVDPYFQRALGAGIRWRVVAASREAIGAALEG